MKVVDNITNIRTVADGFRSEGRSIGLVPTMGALHEGHLSLIRLAHQHADEVIVTIYVNPEQFAPDEDFDEYPRTLETDLEKCKEYDVSAVFTPSDEIMYSSQQFLSINIEKLNEHMDGSSRPGFFEGILLVVNKFFNVIEPDIAVFGQKDIQQFCILERMVREFKHDIKLIRGPIKRANDGLALSSRNSYLSDEQRNRAPGLYRSLRYVKKQIEGGVNNVSLLLEHQKDELEEKGFKIDYLNLFSFDEIVPVEQIQANEQYILAGAVYLGETRLIDNLII